ncbi:DUF5788 family protein [Methanolobus halotolerans]|uniref:DUF5788 family protein n=1 Tax=Methanolobus halotolerans TaxID=2052935 RepID=UPI001F3FAC22|nr:DUF5788 family protein [Methanolobus halotolerans]
MKKELTDKDRDLIDNCTSYIKEKTKEDKLELKTGNLTRDEAKQLFDETAGLMRAIMDLKDIEEDTARIKRKEFHEVFSREKVAEARRWLQLSKGIV